MKSLREILQEDVLVSLMDVDVGTKAALAQLIADFAIGCDMRPVLSERIDAGYTVASRLTAKPYFERIHIIEAYRVLYSEKEASFCVDRSSLYRESDTKSLFEPLNAPASLVMMQAELVCIERGVRDWFRCLLVSKRVGRNDSDDVVRDAIEANVTIVPPQERVLGCMLPLFRDGKLKFSFRMPKLFHLGPGGAPDDFGKFIESANYREPETMYCEMIAHVTNLPRNEESSPPYPIWSKRQLMFHMDSVTYKDRKD